jgi:hypothetical protein
VFGFTTGAEQNFIDPYTRATYPIATITDSIPMTPVYNAYALVGAGYVMADWLLPNEPASQTDGALPISQLISQAIQAITSSDGSVTVTNPNGPSTDLKVTGIAQLLGIPVPVNTGTTIQTYTDPLGDLWVAKNGVYNGAWKRASQVMSGRVYRAAGFTVTQASQSMIFDTVAFDAFGMYDLVTGHLNFQVPGVYLIYFHMNAVPALPGDTIRTDILHIGTPQDENMAQGAWSGGGGPNLTSHGMLMVNSNGGAGEYYAFTYYNPAPGQSTSLTGTASYPHTYANWKWMGIYP